MKKLIGRLVRWLDNKLPADLYDICFDEEDLP